MLHRVYIVPQGYYMDKVHTDLKSSGGSPHLIMINWALVIGLGFGKRKGLFPYLRRVIQE
jgi:hypothetical protein